jgi:hypothetical protein
MTHFGKVNFPSKQWDPKFYQRRNFNGDEPYIAAALQNSPNKDEFDLFWNTCEEDIPYFFRLGELCRDATLEKLMDRVDESNHIVSASLDDWEYVPGDPNGSRREYLSTPPSTRRLTAFSLYKHLIEKVRKFQSPNEWGVTFIVEIES